jgi:hypothetical protein
MLLWINIVVHLAALVMVVALGSYGVYDLMLLCVCLVVTWAAGHFALTRAKSRHFNGLGLLTVGLVIFFWVAYTSKLALAMVIAGDYWVVPKLISQTLLLSRLPESYFVATVGYVMLLTAVLSFPLKHSIDWRILPPAPRFRLIMALLCVGLVVKYLLKVYFSLAVPGLDPVQFGIPYMTGVLALTLEFGFLFLANVPYFLALCSGRRWLIFVALLAALANAAIDLRFGSKDTLMYQMVMTVAYLPIFYRGLSWGRARFRATARGMLIIFSVLGTVVLSTYKYMNFLRYAFLSGTSDIITAVQIAAQSDIAQSRSSIIELYNRITGLETLSAVMHLGENLSASLGIIAMIDGSLMQRFSDIVLGGGESKTSFSMTLVGCLYVFGGIPAIIVGFLFVGLLFGLVQYVVVRAAPVSHNMEIAFLPVLWILFVSLMLGGNPLIWLKTLVVTLVVFVIVGRIAAGRARWHLSKATGTVREDALLPRTVR